jgi:hypothetical protein
MAPPAVLGDLAMDPPEPLPVATTTAIVDGLPAETIAGLVAAAGADSGSPLAMVQIRQLGGALARPPEGAGARATLPGEFIVLALGVPEDEEAGRAVRASLDAVQRVVFPRRVGDYPNFVEEPAEARAFFDEETWTRLRRVKAEHDPANLLKGNHQIPPAGRG